MHKLNLLDLKDQALLNEARTIYIMLKRTGRLQDGTYLARSVNSTDPVGTQGEEITYTIRGATIDLVYNESGQAAQTYTDTQADDTDQLDENLMRELYLPVDRYAPLPEHTL